MQLKNTDNSFGWLAIVLHWLMAIAIIVMFALGLWMVSLDYYHQWYRQAPHIHKSIGLILFALLLFRFYWRMVNPQPNIEASHSLEKLAAKATHWLFYILLLILFISGYMISTADGSSIQIFNWLNIPGWATGLDNQEDLAGEVHELTAYILIGLVVVHLLAALKHHFIDKDKTLLRMFGKP